MPQTTSSRAAARDAEQLRSLTDAVIAVGAGLELDEVLQRLVTTAATISRARYGALGITDESGRIVTFVTHGISPELREHLGGMPTAHGIPGRLLRPGAPALRLAAIGDHPASVGFPPDHPPMRTFLGVPVRVSGAIFGNLYVADKQSDDAGALFTAEDEEALLALGAAAGVAVANARLFAGAQRQRRWSDAVGEAIHAIIARSELDTRSRLAPVAAIARGAAQSDLALLACRESDGSWPIRHCAGPEEDTSVLAGTFLPEDPALRPVPDAVTELDPEQLAWLPGRWRHGLVVPIGGTPTTVENLLLLAYRHDLDPALGPAERRGELAFGQRLGLALQVAQAQADSAALQLLLDRDRIARDLHDHVIQRLFSIGLSLEAALVAARVPEVASRVQRAVSDIDETIHDVRRAIFELHTMSPHQDDLRARVDEVVADVRESLPGQLETYVSGGLETIPPDLVQDLLAVLREGLTNVARHSRAEAVRVYVTVGQELELEIVDDGVGMPADPRSGEGLPNLHHRARCHGGRCELGPAPDGGTVLRWAVPLT